MAQNVGKLFEKDIVNSVPSSVFNMRLRDMGGKYKQLANVKNICDFLMYRYPTLYLLELKSTQGKSLPFTNLKAHQIAGLYVANKRRGIKGGFVFNFRDTNETFYIPADVIYEFIQSTQRKSFPLQWCREVGYKIAQEKKRTRWRYEVDRMLDEI